jgi:hypothetical protein
MSIENSKTTGPIPPEDNSPEAADLLDRAQSGDQDALKQFVGLNMGDRRVILVDDMQGKLAEFEIKKREDTSGEGR